MTDIRIDRLAELIVTYSVEAKEGQDIFVAGPFSASPLIEQIYRHVLLQGGYPSVVYRNDQLEDILFRDAQDHQLSHLPPIMKFVVEKASAMIRVKAEQNPRHLINVDPEKLAKYLAPQREVSDILIERVKKGELTWSLVPFPTNAMAQEASMSLLEYEDFVYKACFVHKENPRKEWERVSQKQAAVVSYLEKSSEVRVVGEDTDLTLSVEGRTWVNSDGKKNLPDGEVFTGPHLDSVEGTIRFTYPAIFEGNEVEDVRLTFQKGAVVEAKAKQGEEFLHQMLKVDEGANKVGEIAIGTNYEITRFTKDMLFDEKMGGTIHMALGRGIPETGSENRSAIHWDMLKDMRGGKIYADGELFYEKGNFLI